MNNRIGTVLLDLVRKHTENPKLSRVSQPGFMGRKSCSNNLLEFFKAIPAKGKRQKKYCVWYTICLDFQKSA